MIKNIFALIGVVTSLVMILGLAHKPKEVTPKSKTKKESQITETKNPMIKEYLALINKNKSIKNLKKSKTNEITETRFLITKEYKQLITVE